MQIGKINIRGIYKWTSGFTYNTGDLVVHEGLLYVPTTSTNSIPSITSTDWYEYSSQCIKKSYSDGDDITSDYVRSLPISIDYVSSYINNLIKGIHIGGSVDKISLNDEDDAILDDFKGLSIHKITFAEREDLAGEHDAFLYTFRSNVDIDTTESMQYLFYISDPIEVKIRIYTEVVGTGGSWSSWVSLATPNTILSKYDSIVENMQRKYNELSSRLSNNDVYKLSSTEQFDSNTIISSGTGFITVIFKYRLDITGDVVYQGSLNMSLINSTSIYDNKIIITLSKVNSDIEDHRFYISINKVDDSDVTDEPGNPDNSPKILVVLSSGNI